MQRCKSDSVDKTIHPADLTEMTEYRTEHWVINDTIISLSVYLDNKPWKESDSSGILSFNSFVYLNNIGKLFKNNFKKRIPKYLKCSKRI